jgi:hypothetical protein
MHGTWDSPKKGAPIPKASGLAKKPPKPTPKGGKIAGKPFPAKGK